MRHVPDFLHIRSVWAAALWYVVLTGAGTWPLVMGLGRDLPGDLGDPLLNTWILAWGAHRLWGAVTGHLGALDGFWSANIFYPEPLALAYSEALIPQVLQILPVYGFTKNAILCYNLVFLSTFVLSGLGVYLLVRELTRDARAAFVGGLLYAFALYRVCQFPHVQVLSSQWMPFVLYGFRRYFASGHARALVGAGAALWAQSLSCGYYLFFFAPFVALYLVWELIDRGRWRDRRTLTAIGTTLAATLAATVPFLIPYLSVRIGRPMSEIVFYSADVYSYLSTSEVIRLWGSIVQIFPKPEGELFPGAVPLGLAAAAVAVWAWNTWRHASAVAGGVPVSWWRGVIGWLAVILVLAYGASLVVMLLSGPTVFSLAGFRVSIRSLVRPVQVLLVALVALVAVSPRARAFVRGAPGSSAGYFIVALSAAFFFSLGPRMKTMGQTLGDGPYAWLLAIEPGMDSVRVPARFAMLVALFLAVLGGQALAAITVKRRRLGLGLAVALSCVFVVEGWSAPIEVNHRFLEDDVRPPDPPGPMRQGERVPPVYTYVATLPEDAVLVELPFGAFAYEFQYMFYSTNHWKPLLNGYSGHFPRSYEERRARLALPRLLRDPDAAWENLRHSGATHAILHEAAFWGDEDDRIGAWLEQHGARLVGKFEYDRLYKLKE